VAGPVLEGLSGGADCELPKKSNPSNESAGFVCLGGAGSAFGGAGLVIDGPVVLGRGGASVGSSPNRSTFCCCLAGGWIVLLEVAAARCDTDLSSLAFS
jgi:hypothetical protein